MNNYWIQFTGKFNTPDPLDDSKTVIIAAEFDHLYEGKKPLGDGSYDIIYKVAPIRMSIESGGKKLEGKLKSNNSKRLRGAIWHYAQENNIEDFDKFYDDMINKIILHIHDISTL